MDGAPASALNQTQTITLAHAGDENERPYLRSVLTPVVAAQVSQTGRFTDRWMDT